MKSKIAIICDTHFGCRSDNAFFLEYFCDFFENQFFPYLEKNKIDTIIHLGDLFDRRKFINFVTFSKVRPILEKLARYNFHCIAGNHDCYYNSTNSLNSIENLCGEWISNPDVYSFQFYTGPTEIDIYGTKILLLPWINLENHEESMNSIMKTKASICMGHLQIQGFEMHVGSVCKEGLTSSLFDKFEYTFSGHFHKKSQIGNIHYLGTPYQWTWADYDTPKGFTVFDCKTRTLEYVQNPNEIFLKIFYDDSEKPVSVNVSDYENKFVRIIIEKKKNPYAFDMFKASLDEVANEVKVIDIQAQNILFENTQTEIFEDTLSILRKTVLDSDLTVDKKKLEKTLEDLYNESLLRLS